jgi:hypothetical protein
MFPPHYLRNKISAATPRHPYPYPHPYPHPYPLCVHDIVILGGWEGYDVCNDGYKSDLKITTYFNKLVLY